MTSTKPAKTLAIFTTLLGNNSYVRQLKRALDQIDCIEPVYVCVGAEDYKAYPRPAWAKLSDPWESRYVARQKLKALPLPDFQLLLVFSWEFAVEFRDLAQRVPAVVFLDSVPSTFDAQLRRRGQTGWKRRVAHALSDRAFRTATPYFGHFFALGSDAAEALTQDYGIDPSKISVTLIPQELEKWTPGSMSHSERLRLLFVGNDFLRKGGDFLLRLFAEHLADFCELTIASNDPRIAQFKMPARVEWLRGCGREQLISVFQRSDIFVFPTRQDFAATNAVCEALACGVPCVVSDVGGIRDVVQEDITGYLMPYDAPAALWAERIRRLDSDRGGLLRLAQGARRFAEQNLSLERFQEKIGSAVARLIGDTSGSK